MTTDIAVQADNVSALDSLDAHAREVAITGMLDQARSWLSHAVESTAPAEDIANFKAFIATAAETAKRLKVSKEIQQDAEVMVRRSERALGQAIRTGQERGEIAPPSKSVGRNGNPGKISIPTPSEYLGNSGQVGHEVYAMTDNVTDEDFEAALDEAKSEGNVSRANVVRKVKERTYSEKQAEKWDRVADMAESGYTSSQIAREVGMSEQGLKNGARTHGITFPADKHTANTRRLDSGRIVRESIASLEGIVAGLELINPDDISVTEAENLIDSLTAITSALAKAKRTIKESIS